MTHPRTARATGGWTLSLSTRILLFPMTRRTAPPSHRRRSIMSRSLGLVLALLAGLIPAGAFAFGSDVNCNGIQRDVEGDCVDYYRNLPMSCRNEVGAPLRKCDDYVAPLPIVSECMPGTG